jgi:hypothetical protein
VRIYLMAAKCMLQHSSVVGCTRICIFLHQWVKSVVVIKTKNKTTKRKRKRKRGGSKTYNVCVKQKVKKRGKGEKGKPRQQESGRNHWQQTNKLTNLSEVMMNA